MLYSDVEEGISHSNIIIVCAISTYLVALGIVFCAVASDYAGTLTNALQDLFNVLVPSSSGQAAIIMPLMAPTGGNFWQLVQ